jgi:predicted aldo/keto reductase-like oxidoreductase
MDAGDFTRREFIGTAAAAAGAAGLAGRGALGAEPPAPPPPGKILNYNRDMEYRRCGKTNLWISAVCLGGHWKRVNEAIGGGFAGNNWLSIDMKFEPFHTNRYDVLSRCMEVGINYVDACTSQECLAYSRALKGRRDRMYLGFSWYQEEMRNAKFRTKEALLGTLEKALRLCELDAVDLWRVTMLEKSGQHREEEVDEMMQALEAAKKQGKARFTGFSSHDRAHIKRVVETYPALVDAVVTPYTARSKELPADSVFEALRKHDVGMFGIKPFSSGSLFKGGGSPKGPEAEEDDALARMAIRYILCNPAITAPIPGLVTTRQVDNVALAVKERRELDKAERARLDRAMDEAWARLPGDYQWLKQWEWV